MPPIIRSWQQLIPQFAGADDATLRKFARDLLEPDEPVPDERISDAKAARSLGKIAKRLKGLDYRARKIQSLLAGARPAAPGTAAGATAPAPHPAATPAPPPPGPPPGPLAGGLPLRPLPRHLAHLGPKLGVEIFAAAGRDELKKELRPWLKATSEEKEAATKLIAHLDQNPGGWDHADRLKLVVELGTILS